MSTLRELKPGQSGNVLTVGGEGALRQHFLDMGVIPGVDITVEKLAPMGDPMELRLRDYELTLRLADAEKIEIRALNEPRPYPEHKDHKPFEHPGLGEGGRYHVKKGENPVAKGTLLNFALAGNQNCGKTTLFNALTGSNQHVGNFPGVTVDRKDGAIRNNPDTVVTDLPGIYSLSPFSAEELVSRQYILDEKPKGIINIVDATNLERNLYLTLQLMELDIPMVLALNMMDEVRGNGGSVDINEMEALLGIPVIPISAAKNEGIDELIAHAVHVARYQERPGRNDFCGTDHRGGAVHRCIHAVMHIIEDHAEAAGIPKRYAATKVIEQDKIVTEALGLSENEKETIEHMIITMEEEGGLDRNAAIAEMRYTFIEHLCHMTYHKAHESKEHLRSRKIDSILTGKYTAIPAFIVIMGLVFYLTFNVIGAFLQNLLASGIGSLTDTVEHFLVASEVNPVLQSLIVNGIFNGVGNVISFLPVIIVLFLFLSILEDSGYMARVAFVMDKMLRKTGLSGRSIVPLLIGFGCTVPGVMASRTMPSERDRKMTIILTPFMSCTAKLPIYGFLTAAFFPEYAGLIMIGLYLLGIVMAVIVASVSKRTIFKGDAVPFVMELPNYRLPGLRNVVMLLWDKIKDFLQRAFSVILIATVVIWFLETFDFGLNVVEDAGKSMLAAVAGKISVIFRPHGLDDWRIVTALIAGIMAKESVVSTLIVLGGTAGVLAMITPASAAALLVFCLLYTPCVAAIAAVRQELGGKWAAVLVVFQCVLAWVVSFLVYLIFR